jgi:internalin A
MINMKSSLTFCILSVTTALLSCQDPSLEVVTNNDQSFEQWCLQKKDLPAETRRTIEVLLTRATTRNCQLADYILRSFGSLDIKGSTISDVRPLSKLSQLTSLSLDENLISDVRPLAGLHNLTSLSLDENLISDVRSLAGLSKLTYLKLDRNQIGDIRPLASLTNLTALFSLKIKSVMLSLWLD